MKLKINGEIVEVEATTVQELAEKLTPAPQTLLIEHNLNALLRSEWKETALSEGDRIEVLRVSAGG